MAKNKLVENTYKKMMDKPENAIHKARFKEQSKPYDWNNIRKSRRNKRTND